LPMAVHCPAGTSPKLESNGTAGGAGRGPALSTPRLLSAKLTAFQRHQPSKESPNGGFSAQRVTVHPTFANGKRVSPPTPQAAGPLPRPCASVRQVCVPPCVWLAFPSIRTVSPCFFAKAGGAMNVRARRPKRSCGEKLQDLCPARPPGVCSSNLTAESAPNKHKGRARFAKSADSVQCRPVFLLCRHSTTTDPHSFLFCFAAFTCITAHRADPSPAPVRACPNK